MTVCVYLAPILDAVLLSIQVGFPIPLSYPAVAPMCALLPLPQRQPDDLKRNVTKASFCPHPRHLPVFRYFAVHALLLRKLAAGSRARAYRSTTLALAHPG